MRRKDDEKQQRIREAVITVALEEGFGGASVSKIAKRAGISPATMYIYYENKEQMLRAVYADCAEALWDALLSAVEGKTDGGEIIESLIMGYFRFTVDNPSLSGFVEQFASSPALVQSCSEIHGFVQMMGLIEQWQARGILKPYSPIDIYALIFQPVKMLAAGAITHHAEATPLLRELIRITQGALLAE